MIAILVLQRGWVAIGDLSRDGEDVILRNGYTIRRWGTSRGLGELAVEGPQSATVLDPVAEVRVHYLTVVMTQIAPHKKWLTLCGSDHPYVEALHRLGGTEAVSKFAASPEQRRKRATK